MLAVTLLLSLTAFSQNATTKEQLVCLPQSTAQKIAVDLIRLDSVTVELKNTQVVLQKTEQKLTEQDSLVLIYKEKLSTYQQEIATQNIRFNTCSERVTKLEKDVVALTDKNKRLKGWLKVFGGGFVTSVGLLVAIIAIK
jgi:chromosome segregation ATPase